MDNNTTCQCRVEVFKSSFFLWTITEWISLDINIPNSSNTTFKQHLIDEFRPIANSVFNIHNSLNIMFLTGLRIGLIHLNELRYNHKFKNFANSKCICSCNESTSHSFKHFNFHIPIRNTLFYQVKKIVTNLKEILPETLQKSYYIQNCII